MDKKCALFFQRQRTKPKVNGTFSVVKNKQKGVLGVFIVETATRYAQLMQLQVKMPKTSRNNVFRRQQTTKKAPSKIFRDFEVGEKVRVVFPKTKNKTKGYWNIFSR